MGLFFTEAGANARRPTQGARTPKVRVNDAERRLLTCDQCPLNHAPLAHAKMAPVGATKPVFYILGEAPNKNADELGDPSIGVLSYLPAEYARVTRFNNTIRCRPTDGTKNRPPDYMEIQCCSRLQVADIEQAKPKIIISFGPVPLNWLMGDNRAVTNWRGRRVPVKVGKHVCWLYPMVSPAWVMGMSNNRKTGDAIDAMFHRDMARIFSDYEAGLPEPYVEDPAEFMRGIDCIQEYGTAGLKRIENALSVFRHIDHGLDIETNMKRPFNPDARILTFAVGTYENTVAFPYLHREARWTDGEKKKIHGMLYDYLRGAGKKWAHNTGFEQEWLYEEFGPSILYDTPWGDTLGQAHVIDERPAKELDELVHLYMGFRLKDLSNLDKSRMEHEPLSKILPYNGMDTKYTHALSMLQGDVLEQLGLTDLYEFMNDATPGFVQMQAKGSVRNMPVIKKLVADFGKRAEKIREKILADPDVAAYTAQGRAFNPSSNDDLAGFFRDFLKLPNPKREAADADTSKPKKYSVDEEVLAQFNHPAARAVLDMRGVEKCLNTYVVPLLDPGMSTHKNAGKHVHADGLIHPKYSQYIAVSGRSTCKDPNDQNYPRREYPEIRGVVGVPPGFVGVAFDYGQLEWRIGAELSGDITMCREIWEGQDVHGHWTDSIGARFVPKKLAEKRKKVRDSIKQYWTFANLYGQTLDGLAWDLSKEWNVRIAAGELEPFFVQFWQLYPALKAYQDELMQTYKDHGYVENFLGQRRHEPCARNEIINHPFQGSAGQLVINAQTKCCEYAYRNNQPQFVPIKNIHDDLTFYLPIASADKDIVTIAGLMCQGTFCEKVPMLVECSVFEKQWDQKEEIAKFTVNEKFELIEK